MADYKSSTSVPHRYKADLGELSPSTRDVLERYSKIPPQEVMPHVYALRDKAFAIFPYPCIGEGRFLQLAIGMHELYPEILERMKTGDQTFLDLGCAFAQDLRRLVADGVDSKQCYGSDLQLDFLNLGYELFRDKDTLQSKFIAADIFDKDGGPLSELDNTIDIINASSFFHLFQLEDQRRAARKCVKLLKARPGSLIVGRQRASKTPGDTSGKTSMFWHSADSWKQFWKEIGEEESVSFDVVVTMKGRRFESLQDSLEDTDDVSMSFSVRRS